MVNVDFWQTKIDDLPEIIRRSIRKGWILEILFILSLFNKSSVIDIAVICLSLVHGVITFLLFYYNLDMRAEPWETWEEYRKSLRNESFWIFILIIALIVLYN